ncbi:MAG TPA: hypothetical protein VML75_11050 [Kofleriaceae bacterium]|nr:hypothetical protein [Kofleriaceae bacterium]
MRLRRSLPLCILASALAFSTAACGGGGDDDDGNQPDPVGDDNTYVVSKIHMPTTAAQANMFGLNLDGDEQGRPDNALGQILSTLAGQAGGSFDLQEAIDEQVNMGDIILLANVQATALTTATAVGTTVYLGDNPGTAPCVDANDTVCGLHLDGSTTFDVSAASPGRSMATLVGQIVGGKLTGGPGKVTIELSLVQGGEALVVNLVGARVEIGAVTADTLMSGKLGGAITEEALDNDILPALHTILSDTIAEDCTGTAAPCCEADSTGQLLIDLFDESEPQDCVVTLEELKNNSLIASLLAPDVDLFDGDPADDNFSPRTDGVKDSLSLGIGFNAVGGVFTPR